MSLPSLSDLKIFGIYQEFGDELLHSYYLERPFGNILIYKTGNLSDYFNEFKKRGGIAKQIDFLDEYPIISEKLFSTFGCSLVGEKEKANYPCEKLEDLKLLLEIKTLPDLAGAFIIKHVGHQLLFLPPHTKNHHLNVRADLVFYHKTEAGCPPYQMI